MSIDLHARANREREAYEAGLKRDRYTNVLSHAGYRYATSRRRLVQNALAGQPIHRALELGAYVWYEWLEMSGIYPVKMTCINITMRELEKGIELAREGTRILPHFRIMDAHKLEFPDRYFDLVCGTGILHHLDLPVALGEIERVLRPGGHFIFSEPLDNNPIGHIVRKLTPHARTEDETPFHGAEIALVRDLFGCDVHYEQLLSVPAGLLSRALFSHPENALMRAAYRADETLAPLFGPLYRKATFVGKRTSCYP